MVLITNFFKETADLIAQILSKWFNYFLTHHHHHYHHHHHHHHRHHHHHHHSCHHHHYHHIIIIPIIITIIIIIIVIVIIIIITTALVIIINRFYSMDIYIIKYGFSFMEMYNFLIWALCLNHYIMCLPWVMPSSMAHTHTRLGWSTHSHNTGQAV